MADIRISARTTLNDIGLGWLADLLFPEEEETNQDQDQ